MAPTIGWVYDLSKENLTKLCERYRVDATGPLAELRSRFVAFLRTQEEREISAIRLEVRGTEYPVDVELAEVKAGGLPSVGGEMPVEESIRPVDAERGVPLNPPGTSSIHNVNMHVLLGMVKPIDVVDGSSPKALVNFLMKANSLFKLDLVGEK